MNVTPDSLAVRSATSTGAAAALDAQRVRVDRALGRKLDSHDPAVVRETAAGLLSELFFKPMLAEMRQFPFGGELANGGQTESIFGERLDEQLADTVARQSGSLLRQLEQTLSPQARVVGRAIGNATDTNRGVE